MSKLTRVDRGLNAIRRNVQMLGRGMTVRVGVMENAVAAQRAIYAEYGTKTAPARPFMAVTARKTRAAYKTFSGVLGARLMAGKISPQGAMAQAGRWYVNQIKMTIESSPSWAAPNAPSTIAKKGSEHPLIETGLLLTSIRWRQGR